MSPRWSWDCGPTRPHSALGPGLPEPPQAKVPAGPQRHQLPDGYRVTSTPVLGGLDHEYWLEKKAGTGGLIDPKVYAGLFFARQH